MQYNTARTLRHLALGSQPAHKTAALPAVVPLTQALQVTPSSDPPWLACINFAFVVWQVTSC